MNLLLGLDLLLAVERKLQLSFCLLMLGKWCSYHSHALEADTTFEAETRRHAKNIFDVLSFPRASPTLRCLEASRSVRSLGISSEPQVSLSKKGELSVAGRRALPIPVRAENAWVA